MKVPALQTCHLKVRKHEIKCLLFSSSEHECSSDRKKRTQISFSALHCNADLTPMAGIAWVVIHYYWPHTNCRLRTLPAIYRFLLLVKPLINSYPRCTSPFANNLLLASITRDKADTIHPIRHARKLISKIYEERADLVSARCE